MKRKTALASMIAGTLALGMWAAAPAYADGTMTLYESTLPGIGTGQLVVIMDSGCQELWSDVGSVANDSTHTIYFYSSRDCSGVPSGVVPPNSSMPLLMGSNSYQVM